MHLVKIISALFLVTFVASEISVKEILTVCKVLGVPLFSSKSLFLGKLLYATDFLRNIRFFHADVQRKVSKVENDIIYVSRPEDSVQGEFAHSGDLECDSSNVRQSINPNLSLIVRLFPSPTGYIEPQTGLSVNFGFIMQHNIGKPIVEDLVKGSTKEMTSSVDFLAFVLYYNSLTNEDKKSFDIVISSFEETAKVNGKRFTVTVKKVGGTAEMMESAKDPAAKDENATKKKKILKDSATRGECPAVERKKPKGPAAKGEDPANKMENTIVLAAKEEALAKKKQAAKDAAEVVAKKKQAAKDAAAEALAKKQQAAEDAVAKGEDPAKKMEDSKDSAANVGDAAEKMESAKDPAVKDENAAKQKKIPKDSAAKVEEGLIFKLNMYKGIDKDILIASKKTLFDTLYLLFDKKGTAQTSENKKEGIDSLLTKSTIIQAFIAQILQTEKQYESFLLSFKKFEDHFKMKMEDNFVDNSKLIETIDRVEEASLPFPYSKNRQPSQNSNIQYFKRITATAGEFFGEGFPNCVESFLYHFLNSLFWNPIKREYEFPAKQKNSNSNASPAEKFAIPNQIVNFYNLKNKMRSNLSDDEWKAWHEIVEDLPDGFLLCKYEDKKSYVESDQIFTSATYKKNKDGHLNELKSGFLNIFVVLATILDKKELLKGISKSCLDEKGKLLETPNKDEFKKFVKKFILGITNLTEDDFEISVSNLRIERVGNKPELMGSIMVIRKFKKKVVEFHLDTCDGHSCVRVEKSPVLKFMERTESGEYIDFTDAKNLIIEYFKFNDQRFFMALYLKSLFEEDKKVVWQNPMEGTVDGILYEDFLRFEIGNNRETFVGLDYFYKIFLASLVETGKEGRNSEDLSGNTAEIGVTSLKGELSLANVNLSLPSGSHSTQCRDNEGCLGAIVDATHLITKISHIIANIILLPLPINDDEIFKKVRKFYELAEFLLKIQEACQHFPNVLPQLSDKQLEDFSKIGKDLGNSLPKTSKFVEFDFEAIDNEDMKIARKEITHKYWDIRTLFNDGAINLKKVILFAEFQHLGLFD